MSKRGLKGICYFCGKIYSRQGMGRHLVSCPDRLTLLQDAEAKKKRENFHHLMVEDIDRPEYWLHLEIKGQAPLAELDRYLRDIWLECCGHLSAFAYERYFSEENEIDTKRRADRVFEPGSTLYYIYDFGSSSELKIKCLSQRQGSALGRHPIVLMARNLAPEFPCIECGKPSRWLCEECLYEEGVFGALCDEHAESHPHDNYGEPVEIVNSPRLGVCGYEGPAEPPYEEKWMKHENPG